MNGAGNGYRNGSGGTVTDGGLLTDEDNAENELFLEVVRRVETLEKLKNGLDERECQLKSDLKGKYEEERSAMKVSSDLLIEKECLRDELIRLKDAREKLIDELQVLKSVDEEMSSFNRINESFNENLRKHLQQLEEKQARIYTLKPIITGTQQACEVDFADRDRGQLHQALVDVLKGNVDQTESVIRAACQEHGIHTTAQHNDLLAEEKGIKQRIRALKNKIKEKQRRDTSLSAITTGDQRGSKRRKDLDETGSDDETGSVASSSQSRAKLQAPAGSSRKRRRSGADPDPDHVCEACHKQCDDAEAFAYHCFRGCSLLEDYMKERGREITVSCPECDKDITSFVQFTEHLKKQHGWESPEDSKKSGSASASGSKKRATRR